MKPGAWSKPKFWRLAQRLGGTVQAAGLLEIVWYEATEYDPADGRLPWPKVADRASGLADVADARQALIDERWILVDGDGLRVNDWHEHRPKFAADRARAREQRAASRDTSALKPRRRQSATVGDSRRQSRKVASCPSPCPSQDPDRVPSEHSPPRAYPPGFLTAWKAYPHHAQRSSKRQAGEAWRRLGLEAHVDAVLAWIAAGKETDDWRKDGGAFVPGMQVWLKRIDVTEPPEAAPTEGWFDALEAAP